MVDFTNRGLGGLVLMVLGTLVLVQSAMGVTGGFDTILIVGALLLTVGTYLVGTDVSGTPV